MIFVPVAETANKAFCQFQLELHIISPTTSSKLFVDQLMTNAKTGQWYELEVEDNNKLFSLSSFAHLFAGVAIGSTKQFRTN